MNRLAARHSFNTDRGKDKECSKDTAEKIKLFFEERKSINIITKK